MPQIKVIITYDQPDHPYWLNPDKVALCLRAYCRHTEFEVEWADDGIPQEWKDYFRATTRGLPDA